MMKLSKKYRNRLLYLIVFAIGMAGSIAFISWQRHTQEQKAYIRYIKSACLSHTDPGIWHIHTYLQITVDGKITEIPKRLNFEGSCMRPIHTHSDMSGRIHLMFPNKTSVRLGDIFYVWGKKFSKDQVFDKKVDSEHELTMTVNGHPNYDFENLLMHDQDKIVIEYKHK